MEIFIGGEWRSVAVEEFVGRVPELAELQGKLRDSYLREPGTGADAADLRAQRTLRELVRAALSDFGNAYVNAKSALLDQILVTRAAIHDFYVAMMDARGNPPKIEDVRAKFGELRKALRDVATPAEELAPGQKPGEELAAERQRITEELKATPKAENAKVPVSASTTRLFRKGFRWVADRLAWVKRYTTGYLEYEIGPDGLYKVRSFRKGSTVPDAVFSEYDVVTDHTGKPVAYKDKPLSSSVMQAHHGLQDALMEDLFGADSRWGIDLGYNGKEAPTIWLRNSTGESPHGRVTHEMQNPNQADRMKKVDSYAAVRDLGVRDLKAVGARQTKIDAYLDAIDAHFRDKILPRINDAVKNGQLSPAAARKLIGGTLFGEVIP